MNMTITKLFFAAVAAAGVAAAQESITITVDGIGSSCSVQAWTFGASDPTHASSGSGAVGAGRSQVSALVLSRLLDKCSTQFFALTMAGKSAPAATLTQTDANGKPVLVIKLRGVYIASYQESGSASNPLPGESVSLAFEQIDIQYSGPGGPTQAGWDIARNVSMGF
jgi:type VI protein secretion system component Hcp